MKKISIIIINYNGKRFLKRLFESIQHQTFRDYEVILVDNDSSDDSVKFLRDAYPDTKIVRSKNNGYGAGCNAGAKDATGIYLLFFNEDMYLPHDFLESMINFRKKLPPNIKIGAISCKMADFDSDPKIFPPSFGSMLDIFGFPVKSKSPNFTFAISGSPFMISRELFSRVKGFNEMIFLYGEDMDLSWRLKIFGYDNFMNNETNIHHFGGGSTGGFGPSKIANIIFGSFIPIFTNYGLVAFTIVLPLYLLYISLFYIALTLVKFNMAYICEIIKKKRFFMENIKKATGLRKFVQKNRTRSDFYVLKYIFLFPAFIRNRSFEKLSDNYKIKNY